jgi:hypothetical protein
MPSTMPRITARIASDIIIQVRYDRMEPKKPGSSRLFVSMLQSQKNGKTGCLARLLGYSEGAASGIEDFLSAAD